MALNAEQQKTLIDDMEFPQAPDLTRKKIRPEFAKNGLRVRMPEDYNFSTRGKAPLTQA